MKILLIEDNFHHAEHVSHCLRDHFQNIDVEIIKTEYDVRKNIEKLAKDGIDIIILDIILPWCEPQPDMPIPSDDLEKQSPYRAGVRCIELFLNHPNLANIPIIVHSVVDTTEIKETLKTIPPNILFLGKPIDPEKMAVTIESFLLASAPERRKKSTKESLLDASDLKIGLRDFKIDLKKLFKRNKS